MYASSGPQIWKYLTVYASFKYRQRLTNHPLYIKTWTFLFEGEGDEDLSLYYQDNLSRIVLPFSSSPGGEVIMCRLFIYDDNTVNLY